MESADFRSLVFRDFHTQLRISQELNGRFTTSRHPKTYRPYAMKQAFVLQLGSGTDTSRREFAGFVEEVDTGRELRFRSTEELLEFLAQCFDDARRAKSEIEENPP